jgi:hypothetical protein
VSWKEIAEASGAVAFPTMDLMDFTGHFDPGLNATWPGVFDHAPTVGSLPPELMEPIAARLALHTSTAGQCWFAAWNGFGNPRDDVRLAPMFRLPHREYNLLTGPVAAATESVTDGIRVQSPSLWWPDDHAWCVATEIDLNTTYIACSKACRDDILSLPGVEALAIKAATA